MQEIIINGDTYHVPIRFKYLVNLIDDMLF